MRSILLLLFTFFALSSGAQIGYQVALLNNATGEPRANETVNVTVKITDKDEGLIFEQSGQSTTNDFGVLSLTVGNSDTFANADWSKLPFFIEATVGGRLIGKSQLLSVPVAEHAKHVGVLTKELLCSRNWKNYEYGEVNKYMIFEDNNKCKRLSYDNSIDWYGTYLIEGNDVIVYYKDSDNIGDTEASIVYKYDYSNGRLLDISGEYFYK